MKVICISDTHGLHKEVALPEGDLLIHAGDVTSRGTLPQVIDFIQWFERLEQFRYKIFIAGNHDFFFEDAEEIEVNNIIPENIIYLNDSGIEIEGLKIWGSPIQPEFYNWAFNRKRGEAIKKHWDMIPDEVDVLITHGPPANILDKTTTGLNVGCQNLLDACLRARPKFHVFGHIHEAYGVKKTKDTTFLNASLLNEKYQLENKPICLNF